jgi:hypothetical protein
VYITWRHPPQSREIFSNSAKIHRRAAPIPRVAETVSDAVCRVPNATSARIVSSMRAGEAESAMA